MIVAIIMGAVTALIVYVVIGDTVSIVSSVEIVTTDSNEIANSINELGICPESIISVIPLDILEEGTKYTILYIEEVKR